jgi:hypothetical protein
MSKVYDIGTNTYVQRLNYPTRKFPLYDHGITREIDPPYRVGFSRVIRVPFSRKALVVGQWVSVLPETDALINAIGARPLESDDWDNVDVE